MRIDVVLEREAGEPTKIETGKCSKDSDGYTQEHAKRKSPTLVKRRENQKTKKKRETEDNGRRHALLSLLLLVRHAEVIKAHIWRHGLCKDFLHCCHSLSRAVTGISAGIDLCAPKQVVTQREFRAHPVINRNHRGQGHHAAGAIANVKLAQVLGPGPIVTLGLNVNLPLAAEAVEVIDERASHEGLKSFVHVTQIDTLSQNLVPLNVDKDLRNRRQHGSKYRGQLRTFARGLHERIHILGEEADVMSRTIFEHEGHPTRSPNAGDCRRRECDRHARRKLPQICI